MSYFSLTHLEQNAVHVGEIADEVTQYRHLFLSCGRQFASYFYCFEYPEEVRQHFNTVMTTYIFPFHNAEEIRLLNPLRNAQPPAEGIQAAEIDRYTSLVKYKNLIGGMEQTTCAVCLDNFERNSKVRTLNCNHAFHHDCIQTWLSKKAVCPLCKANAKVEKPVCPDPEPAKEKETKKDGQSKKRQKQHADPVRKSRRLQGLAPEFDKVD